MNYIIYARKSTESEDRQSLSIQSQIIEMEIIAKRENLHVVKVFQESKSAKAPGRPVFAEMIKFIEQGKAEGILCWKIDRLARNPVDEGTLKWMLQNQTIGSIKTFDRDYNPEDNVVIASIEFSMANQYIRDLSKNVKRGQAEKIRRGEYPSAAPPGYMTDFKTKRLLIDPKVAPSIQTAYELYATKRWSLRRIGKKLSADGFRSSRGNPINKTRLQRILTNPLYCGLFEWKGQVYKGTHPPLISHKLFEQAQQHLYPERYLKREDKRFFMFRGLMVCGECGLKVTAEIKKGHTYYRCTKSRGAEQCSQRYTREEDLTKAIGEKLKEVEFDEEIVQLIVDASQEEFLKRKDNEGIVVSQYQEHLARVTTRKDSLVKKFIDDLITKDVYEQMLSQLTEEELSIEESIQNTGNENIETIQHIKLIGDFVKSAHDIFNRGDNIIKKEVADLLSSNLGMKDRKVAYFNINEPFAWFVEDANTLLSRNQTLEPVLSHNKSKTAPLGAGLRTWRERRDSDPRPPQ